MAKFLIVDDSSLVRKFMMRCLNDLGFDDLDEAPDGADALDKVKIKMPEVILLDWNMPYMDGLEFLKLLRKLPNGKNPKVIFCSSNSDASKIKLALDNSADEYIVKPVDARTLRQKFKELGIIPAAA